MSLLQINAQEVLRKSHQLSFQDTALILRMTRQLANVLEASHKCARISLNGASILLGPPDCLVDYETPEFIFESKQVFLAVFEKSRLLSFALAYVDGQMKINGSLEKAVEILDLLNVQTDRPRSLSERLGSMWFQFCKAFIRRQALKLESSDNYGTSAQAYELILDSRMQYTCGRFLTDSANIEEAQVAKFAFINDLTAKHGLFLAGKDHLDIGCGWGGMISHFEEVFQTRSVGNTNSLSQLEYAKRRFGAEILYGDFSELKGVGRKFNLITIVGMIEHLTPSRRSHLLQVARSLLHDDGFIFVQCITKPAIWIGGDAYRFVQREVFPGHFLETPLETERRFRDSGFAVIEQFDHGHDYGLTTAHWVQNIQRNQLALTSIVGARQYRVYLGYLLFASRMFSTGRGSLFRYLLRKV